MAPKPTMSQADNVIARAYEALGDEHSWDDVIASYVRLAGGDSGLLYLKTGATPDGAIVASCGAKFSEKWLAHYFYYEPLSPLIEFFRDLPTGELRALGEFAFSSTYRDTEFFYDWIRPQGWADMIAGHLFRNREVNSWFAIRRLDRQGRFRANEVQIPKKIAPHFGRAVRLKTRIAAERAMSPAGREFIDCLSCGIVIVDVAGMALVFNSAAERLMFSSAGLGLYRGKIACQREPDRTLLENAILAAARPLSYGREPATDLVINRRDARPVTVHVIPLSATSGWGSAVASRAVAAIFLIDPDVEARHRVDVVAVAYGLTPAEGRLLREVSNCRGLLEAAQNLKVTEATARTHLQRIFSKTGTRTQAELVSLLARSALR